MTNDKESVIREKRTIDATKNNLMGMSGKFGVILKAFGNPIIRQGSGLYDAGYIDDPFEDVAEEYSSTVSDQQGPVAYRDEILESQEGNIQTEGFMFDGLSRGLHLEIIHTIATNELKVSYKGFIVYREVAGDLEAYAPFPEWENMIDRLYRSAKERVKVIRKEEEQEIGQKVQESKKTFWQALRLRWGI